MRKFGFTLAVLAGAIATAPVSAALIADDFEVDSSASYTVVETNGPDSTIIFAYDYVTAGYALAPNSTAGDMGGLYMTVNNSLGAANALTAFNNIDITESAYLLSVDIYMGVEGSSGTTEFAHIGVAGDGVTGNTIFTPISGTGHFLAMTGEGGSSSDYRHFIEPGTPVNSGDPSYWNSTNTTNATGNTYQAIFPDTDFPGSPGNSWTTLTIQVDPVNVTYYLDGVAIIRTPTLVSDGQVSLGYHDAFTSVSDAQFIIYDNLNVEAIPEPASLALMGLGGLAMIRRR